MSKHTKGPWKADQGSADDPKRWVILADSEPAWLIATVENGQPGDTLDTEKATAHLIAAAPALLEACETFAAWLKREDDGFPDRDKRDTPEGERAWSEWYGENLRLCALALLRAHAAIDKANGDARDD